MSLELEDYKPEAPRVLRASSVREGVLMSIIVHLAMAVVVGVSPVDAGRIIQAGMLSRR